MGLGITAKRNPKAFEKAFVDLEQNYDKHELAVKKFKKEIAGNIIAKQHIELYKKAVNKRQQQQQQQMLPHPPSIVINDTTTIMMERISPKDRF